MQLSPQPLKVQPNQVYSAKTLHTVGARSNNKFSANSSKIKSACIKCGKDANIEMVNNYAFYENYRENVSSSSTPQSEFSKFSLPFSASQFPFEKEPEMHGMMRSKTPNPLRTQRFATIYSHHYASKHQSNQTKMRNSIYGEISGKAESNQRRPLSAHKSGSGDNVILKKKFIEEPTSFV